MGEVLLSATELAARLGVTKGRISQYVAGDKLQGCWSGDGRMRRFDLVKVCEALGKRLDPGQMLGNGAATRRTIVGLRQPEAAAEQPFAPTVPKPPRESGELLRGDSDRYELARAAKAEEDLRSARLRNGREEGLYVLTSEVEMQVSRVMAQEIAEMEAVLRDAARNVADKLSVDFRSARQILLDTWRGHRAQRATALTEQAASGEPSEAEKDGDI